MSAEETTVRLSRRQYEALSDMVRDMEHSVLALDLRARFRRPFHPMDDALDAVHLFAHRTGCEVGGDVIRHLEAYRAPDGEAWHMRAGQYHEMVMGLDDLTSRYEIALKTLGEQSLKEAFADTFARHGPLFESADFADWERQTWDAAAKRLGEIILEKVQP